MCGGWGHKNKLEDLFLFWCWMPLTRNLNNFFSFYISGTIFLLLQMEDRVCVRGGGEREFMLCTYMGTFIEVTGVW